MGGNVYAYPALAGMNLPPGQISVPVDFGYPYDVTLTALQSLNDEAVSIHTDSDFELRAIRLARATGAFRIRLNDSQGYYLSAAKLYSGNFLSGSVPFPFPLGVPFIFPAGSRIGIEIEDLSNAQNVIEILFEGAKRYRLQR